MRRSRGVPLRFSEPQVLLVAPAEEEWLYRTIAKSPIFERCRLVHCSTSSQAGDVAVRTGAYLIILYGPSLQNMILACEQLRWEGVRTPIYALLAGANHEQVESLLIGGADAVVNDVEQVLLHAGALLRRNRAARDRISGVIQLSGPQGTTAQPRNQDKQVTGIEAELSAYLLERPGVCVPWTELAVEVLGEQLSDLVQKRLYQYVWRLRSKMNKRQGRITIQRGVGCCYEPAGGKGPA